MWGKKFVSIAGLLILAILCQTVILLFCFRHLFRVEAPLSRRSGMSTKEPAWKKFLKLKSEVPVASANIADHVHASAVPLKRKREVLAPQKSAPSLSKSTLKKQQQQNQSPEVLAEEKRVKANQQRKRAKTKGTHAVILGLVNKVMSSCPLRS